MVEWNMTIHQTLRSGCQEGVVLHPMRCADGAVFALGLNRQFRRFANVGASTGARVVTVLANQPSTGAAQRRSPGRA